jgi:hypothetical protein
MTKTQKTKKRIKQRISQSLHKIKQNCLKKIKLNKLKRKSKIQIKKIRVNKSQSLSPRSNNNLRNL